MTGGIPRFRAISWSVRIVIVLAFLALWQLLVSGGVFDATNVSTPSDVWDQLTSWFGDGSVWGAVGETFRTFLIGYAVGLVVGVVLGVLAGLFEGFRMYISPFVTFANAIPKLVLIPFLIAWLGFGSAPGVIVVASVMMFVVALTVQNGVLEIQGRYIENALALGASRTDLAREVYVPSTALWVVTSARVAIGLGFQAAVVSEFLGSGAGLGGIILHGQQLFLPREIFGAIVLTVLLAWIMDALLAVVDRRVTRWVPTPS